MVDSNDAVPRLEALVRLTDWLGQKGLPVSLPVAALDGRLQVEIDGVSLSLQREIGGGLLDVTQPDQVREAGFRHPRPDPETQP